MSGKIVSFPRRRTHFGPKTLEARAQMGQVIDRQDFRYWMKKPPLFTETSESLKVKTEQMLDRVTRIKMAHERGHAAEVVTQSARVAIIAEQMGLPRTAELATEIGEIQMAGRSFRLLKRIQKLESIVMALSEDFLREAR